MVGYIITGWLDGEVRSFSPIVHTSRDVALEVAATLNCETSYYDYEVSEVRIVEDENVELQP